MKWQIGQIGRVFIRYDIIRHLASLEGGGARIYTYKIENIARVPPPPQSKKKIPIRL